jgi:PTS system mannose-specific IIB component
LLTQDKSLYGWAAEQLLKTAEMLLGNQDNVGWIDFVPGENAETLIEKYRNRLENLDTSQGVIFLVDTWGGSPFNAASRIVVDQENYEVVAGVNIPMLVEVLMARDDNPAFGELVAIAVETGREGVKALKAKQEDPAPVKTPAPASQPVTPMAAGDHMKIALARIDDRLIHGQVATRWTKETNVTRIIVVSDEVANDHVRKTLLTQVAPPGVTAHVVDVDKMVRVWNNPKYGQDRVMLLFTNPTDVVRIVEQGVEIKSVNIGGMAFRQGKTQVNNAVSVDEKDIAAFRQLNERQIELEVRKVSNDPKLKMMDLIAKVNA